MREIDKEINFYVYLYWSTRVIICCINLCGVRNTEYGIEKVLRFPSRNTVAENGIDTRALP
jgi:hypothetical protein